MGLAVTLDAPRDATENLAPILELVAADMAGVNKLILDRAISDVELIPELAHHLIDSGGKRLRPMLTLAAAKLCNYAGDGHVKLAAAVEFMHTATLLHDDVVLCTPAPLVSFCKRQSSGKSTSASRSCA